MSDEVSDIGSFDDPISVPVPDPIGEYESVQVLDVSYFECKGHPYLQVCVGDLGYDYCFIVPVDTEDRPPASDREIYASRHMLNLPTIQDRVPIFQALFRTLAEQVRQCMRDWKT